MNFAFLDLGFEGPINKKPFYSVYAMISINKLILASTSMPVSV